MEDKDLFVVESPVGYTVSCSQYQWATHIEPGHPELKNRVSDVKCAVEHPYRVYQSAQNPERHVHYSYPADCAGRTRYTEVITGPSSKRYNEHTVVTAYDVAKIREHGEEKGIIYDSCSDSKG